MAATPSVLCLCLLAQASGHWFPGGCFKRQLCLAFCQARWDMLRSEGSGSSSLSLLSRQCWYSCGRLTAAMPSTSAPFLRLLAQASGHFFTAGVAWPGVEALTEAVAVPGVVVLTEAVAVPGVEASTEAGALAAAGGMARARVKACPLLRLQPIHPSSPSIHLSIHTACQPSSQPAASQPASQLARLPSCGPNKHAHRDGTALPSRCRGGHQPWTDQHHRTSPPPKNTSCLALELLSISCKRNQSSLRQG